MPIQAEGLWQYDLRLLGENLVVFARRTFDRSDLFEGESASFVEQALARADPRTPRVSLWLDGEMSWLFGQFANPALWQSTLDLTARRYHLPALPDAMVAVVGLARARPHQTVVAEVLPVAPTPEASNKGGRPVVPLKIFNKGDSRPFFVLPDDR